MTATVQSHPLISIRSEATVQDAARLMADGSIGALGVLDPHKRFVGIITERDLSWFVAQAKDASATPVGEIVNDFPLVVDGPIEDRDALERMRTARIRHLIVRQGDDFRIVSMRDYLAAPRVAGSGQPRAGDVMTAPAIACRDEAFFEEVAETLAERDISGMPVVDARGEVVGVISERDIAHALGGPMVRLALRRHNHGPLRNITRIPRSARRAKDVMTAPPLTVGLETALDEVARLLRAHQVNRVPVVEDGRLIGVVTRGDVLAAIAHLDHAEMDLTRPPVLVGSAGMYPGTFTQ